MKMVRLVCCFCLLLVSLLAVGLPGIALAQDEEEPAIVEKITLTPTYPTVESIAGGDFEFLMDLAYVGAEPSVFDLRVTAPKGWDVYITPRYEQEKKISSISLKAGYGAAETIRVVAGAPFWPLPEPGDYKIIIEAVSEKISGSAELTARVTAIYKMALVSTSGLYDTKVKAGKDNYFAMQITADPRLDSRAVSTAAIDNVSFSSNKPEGWNIKFTPEKIDVLNALDTQTVDVNINPPAKAVAGDYYVYIRASGEQTSTDEVKIRVTVETPTIWGWVGVVIILIVVIGLITIFMRFSRR
jgi:uncharacterized membrane protein